MPGGRLIFAQSIPRHTQRLYRLIEWGRETKLRDKVIAAEEAIYTDLADPMVNWDETDLAAALEAAGLNDIRLSAEEPTEERLITTDHLDRWFGSGEGRPSYQQRLAGGGLTDKEVEKVERLFRGQLIDQAVGWSARLVIVRAELRD